MVSGEDAYHKVFDELYFGYYAKRCIMVDRCYVFFPIPANYDGKSRLNTGTIYPAVDAYTGEVLSFDITDHDLSKSVNVEIKFQKKVW